jgi:hypothetical protein
MASPPADQQVWQGMPPLSRGSRTSRPAIDTARHLFPAKLPACRRGRSRMVTSPAHLGRRSAGGSVVILPPRRSVRGASRQSLNVRLPEARFFVKRLPSEAPAAPPGAPRAGAAVSCHGCQACSTSRRALSPRRNVGAPPGTSVASRTSNKSSLLAPRRTARGMCATSPSRPTRRKASRAMATNSRTLAET